jgi:hypothetical protein
MVYISPVRGGADGKSSDNYEVLHSLSYGLMHGKTLTTLYVLFVYILIYIRYGM